jgi:hypothetical protein
MLICFGILFIKNKFNALIDMTYSVVDIVSSGSCVGSFRTILREVCKGTLDLQLCKAIPVQSRRMRWAGHVARMGEDRGVHRVLAGRPKGKRPLGRPRRRWEDNIKMDLQEIGGVVGTGWSWLRIGTGGGHL